MNKAPVNKILPASVVDGPGSRAVIFLQGCNLHCAYCHNPETQRLCIHCGICVPGCPSGALQMREDQVAWEEKKCVGCDRCIQVCPHNASPKIKQMTPREVYEKVMESVPFIRGITVSGGECTLYPTFLTELFRLVKAEGLTCLLDSNGMVDLALHPELMTLCDGVMLDVKGWDNAVHTTLTGFGNAMVKQNLAYLASIGKLAELRVVCLPNAVDVEAVLAGIAQSIGPTLAKQVPLRLTAFRRFGVRGRLENMPTPCTLYMQSLAEQAKAAGFAHIQVV